MAGEASDEVKTQEAVAVHRERGSRSIRRNGNADGTHRGQMKFFEKVRVGLGALPEFGCAQAFFRFSEEGSG